MWVYTRGHPPLALFDDQHRGLFGVIVPFPDHAQRSLAEVDRVAGAPVRNGRLELPRVSSGAVLVLEPEQKSHPASLRVGGAGRPTEITSS